MRHFETTKLFYDQYKYKLVVMNALGHVFRNRNLTQTRKILDSLQLQVDNGKTELVLSNGYRRQYFSLDVFFECKRLYREFLEAKYEYKIRVERSYLTIYSNNKPWLEKLKTQVENPKEFWAPRINCEEVIANANVIVTRRPPEFMYRVSLSSGRKVDPGLASWLRANTDKAKATEKCIELIERQEYPRGQFFYVRDEKVLQLAMLMIDKVGRIDKLVYVDDQDK